MENATATLTTYITDMHALINHGLQAIDRQVDSMRGKRHVQAFEAVQEFQRTLRTHLTMLDARTKALGGKTTQPIKDAVTTVAGFFAGLIGTVRPAETPKAIRDDYTFLSHVAIGYLMLVTTATSLGDRETATLAESGYRDAARMVMLIDRIMPRLVIEELREDNLPISDVAEQVVAMIPDAWKREAENLGLDTDKGQDAGVDVRA